MLDDLHKDAVGLRLGRITQNEELILCEAMRLDDGFKAIHTILRRANLSGRVEIAGNIENHLADVLDEDGDILQTIALDSGSYGAIKNKWMRCKVDRELTPNPVGEQ